MPVYSVIEAPKTTANRQFDGQTGTDEGDRHFTVAVLDDPSQTTAEVIKIIRPFPLPPDNSVHPQNASKILRSLEVTQHDGSPLFYDAVAHYSHALTSRSQQGQYPWDEAPIYEFDFAVSEEAIDQDVAKNPIIMKTGESFDPPIRRPFGDLVIHQSRNVLFFKPISASNVLYCTNSDTFLGFPPGTCLCTKIQATEVPYQNGFYWKREISVQVRRGAPRTTDERAWGWRRIAAGYYWMMPNANVGAALTYSPVRAYDANGLPSSKPLLHQKDNGRPFTKADGSIDYDPNRAEWYEFQIYRTQPFSSGNI